MKTTLVFFSSLALLAFASGCTASYGHTDIDKVASGETGGSVTSRAISVPLGTVVTAHIAPFNTDGHPMEGSVEADDVTILQVDPTTIDKTYAFQGTKLGQTDVSLIADGIVVAIIHAEVVPQP
ncbi:MAG: hypothetical protein ABIP89_12945 [Polyangiaceae bacterium]